jgi:prepilin-type N-terminal cleavage/methylation domain-containing protein
MRRSSAFTLVELLIAITILSLLVVLLASLLSGVSRAWVSSEQQIGTFQDGRAITDLISRDLSQSVISPQLQFIQNPGNLSTAPNTLLTSTTQVANTESLFWQTVSASDALGNVNEVGYYLTHRADSNGIEHFELRRFFVSPADPRQPPSAPVANPSYHIYDVPSTVYYNSSSTTIMPPWINLNGKNLDPARTDFEFWSSVVSDGVVGFWIRCLDRNGEAIPWLSSADNSTSPIRYNSTAYFQPAIPGQAASFKYTKTSSTVKANLLPATVELTIVTVDSRTMQRKPTIPAVPAGVPTGYPDVSPTGFGPEDIPNAIDWFNRQLITNGVKNARTFTTRVSLKNSGQ